MDEAQDLTRLQWEFIFGTLVDAHTKIVVVGDQSQSIYSFCGVDVKKSLTEIPHSLHNGVVINKSITACFRCATSVVAVAQLLVGELIKPFPGKFAGEVDDMKFEWTDLDVVTKQFKPGDLVLCANNRDAARFVWSPHPHVHESAQQPHRAGAKNATLAVLLLTPVTGCVQTGHRLAFHCAQGGAPVGISSRPSIKTTMLKACDIAIQEGGGELSYVRGNLKDLVRKAKAQAEKTLAWGEWSKTKAITDEFAAFIEAGEFATVEDLRKCIDEYVIMLQFRRPLTITDRVTTSLMSKLVCVCLSGMSMPLIATWTSASRTTQTKR